MFGKTLAASLILQKTPQKVVFMSQKTAMFGKTLTASDFKTLKLQPNHLPFQNCNVW
jgi:hypothetical protein